MGDKTGISWTNSSWNCVRGCSRVMAEGATQSACGDASGGGCYAERDGGRFCGEGMPYDGLVRITAKGPRWTGRVDWIPHMVGLPIRWATPRKIFVNSVSDFFHEKLDFSRQAIMFAIMALADWHIYQVLTKRAERMEEWFLWQRLERIVEAFKKELLFNDELYKTVIHRLGLRDRKGNNDQVEAVLEVLRERLKVWPLPQVHMGVSVEHQWAADERIPPLLNIPAAVRYLSMEPLLGDTSLFAFLKTPLRDDALKALKSGPRPGLDWVIIGTESGPRSRDTVVDWIRSIRNECAQADVPIFLKQAPEGNGITFGPGSKRKMGALIEMPYLDDVQHVAFPG
jgi:protein gp37